MKKILTIVAIVVAAICIPVTVFAWNDNQVATPIYGADCRPTEKVDSTGHYIRDSAGNYVMVKNCSVTVYRFTDRGHTCYLAKGSNAGGIYCVE